MAGLKTKGKMSANDGGGAKSAVSMLREPQKKVVLRWALPLPIAIATSVALIGLHNLGWLQALEGATMDTLIRFNTIGMPHIFLVKIKNADYQHIFNSQSPINPQKLGGLVNAICSGEPKVVVIDISTSADYFKGLKVGKGNTKIIWGRGVTLGPADENVGQAFIGDKVLASDNFNDKNTLWGVALMPQDPDGVIRQFCRFVKIKDTQDGEPKLYPTMSSSAIKAFTGKDFPEKEHNDDKFLLRSAGGSHYLPSMDADTVLQLQGKDGWKDAVKDKIVMLGAYYDSARDNYPSTYGPTAGVELQAQAIETDLLTKQTPALNRLIVLASELLAAAALVAVNKFAKQWWQTAAFIAAAVGGSFAYSYVSYSSPGLWISLAGVLAAVQLQQTIFARPNLEKIAETIAALQAANAEAVPPQPVDNNNTGETTIGIISRSTPRMNKMCVTCGMEFAEDSLDLFCPKDLSELNKVLSDDLVGTTFAERYQIESVLGFGGMSTVYKAKHTYLNTTVAVKILRSHLESDKQSIMRFQREAKATVDIKHPNVIGVHDFGFTEQGRAFMVMDFIEGDSLHAALKKYGRMAVPAAVNLFSQVCDGLACVHKRGILHRDLKPSNIMLISHEGRLLAKIVDFGLAKSTSTDPALTAAGEVIGSPLYMSPEQCFGDGMDARSDIYSMGCIMYECLSGKPPFEANNALALFRAHVEQPPEPFAPELQIPSWLEDVVMTALAKSPIKRFSSIMDMKACLDHQRSISDVRA